MKLLVFACLACVTSHVYAEQLPASMSSIRVTGEALASAKPQRAQVTVGVLTQERQSQPAAAQNSRISDAVLAALHRLLGDDADIKTINHSLSPDYQYRPSGGKPTVNGYTVSTIMQVTLDDLDKVGSVIDTAVQAGANHVESVQYTVRDPQSLRVQALRDAAAKARADADTLAAALNLKIVRIVRVEEVRDVPPPPTELLDPEGRLPPGGDPTPIQPPTFEYAANVALTVEVSPR